MEVVSTRQELDNYLSGLRKRGIKIGFIPTMGALHPGHISLVSRSVEENDYTVVSVFVNRLQFNNNKDFETYPDSREEDIKLLSESGCDLAFFPDPEVMYPAGYSKVKLDLGELNNVLEGPMRPGHYDGVVQVVYRLFDYVKPDKAYFGLKDYQQCLVIKLLRNAFFPHIVLQFCETSRMENGLAMSSRNLRLSAEGIKRAGQIYKVLETIKKLSDHIEVADAIKYGRHLLKEAAIETEYLELANADTLQAGKKWYRKGKNVVLIAVYIDNVRLIDNIIF